MRILTISNWFPPRYVGGAEVSAFYTTLGLRQRGLDARVLSICRKHPEPFDNRLEYHGIPIREIGLPRKGGAWGEVFDREIFRLTLGDLRANEPDLVHLHNVSGASLAPLLACYRLGIPVVITLHDHWLLCAANVLYQRDGSLCRQASVWSCCGRCYERYDHWAEVPLRRKLFSLLTSRVKRFLTPSRRLMELHANCGYGPDRFRVIPYGIQPELTVVPDGSSPPAALGRRIRGCLRAGPEHVLFFSGALVETKGLDTLLEALPLVSKFLGPVQLWVAGAGEGRLSEKLRCADGAQVEMLGRLSFDQVRAVYGAAGLTVVPSVWFDNSPVVIYESLMAGTPVLGARLGGIPELIVDGHTGYLFEPRDAADLAAQVLRHFSRPALERRQMRRACRDFAVDRLNLERHLDAVIGEYRAILN